MSSPQPTKIPHQFLLLHLGLEHIFEGGCNQADGDGIADTYPQLETYDYVDWAGDQCQSLPSSLDTCPNRAGKDDMTNFMQYTYSECMQRLVQKQSE